VIPMPTEITAPVGLALHLDEYVQWLEDRRYAPKSVRKYGIVARQFIRWLIDNDRPTDAEELSELDVKAFLRASRQSGSPATHNARFMALRSFLKFLMREGLLEGTHATSGRRVPVIAADLDAPPRPQAPDVPIITEDEFNEMVELIAAERPRTFNSTRDEAIVRLYWETGARLSEIAHTDVDDYRFDRTGGNVWVIGKGAKRQGPRRRCLEFGPVTAVAIDRYLKQRAGHPLAGEERMWLGRGGSAGRVAVLSDTGVGQMLERRAKAIVADFHPHMFRHAFAHRFLDRGGEEGDLMRIMGWTDRTMLDRYARMLQSERARKNLRKVMGW
jgi:integrase/recombinase XerC